MMISLFVTTAAILCASILTAELVYHCLLMRAKPASKLLLTMKNKNSALARLSPATLTEPQLAAVHALARELGLRTGQGVTALAYFAKQALLLDAKQQDYGPHNISSFGLPGVLVRMNDKMERLKTLAGNERRKARNESIRDSLMDITNYGAIGLMVEDGAWLAPTLQPNVDAEPTSSVKS